MKTRIIVYTLLAAALIGAIHYTVVKKQAPTGRGTGMGASYSSNGFGNIKQPYPGPKFRSEIPGRQRGKITWIMKIEESDYYDLTIVRSEGGRNYSYSCGIPRDSSLLPLVISAYQTQSECYLSIDGYKQLAHIELYVDENQTMNRLKEINTNVQTIKNYVYNIWNYVYHIYRRVR